ncbi:MAG TPA: MFS transporter [Anaerolineales bacterium]|nr:MFS transporter [Anaerolineales bacterium]
MKTFHATLANSLAAFLTNNFVWFAVTFWVFLETRSVIVTSVMAGVFTLTVAFSGFLLGSLVDRYPKKKVMLLSSLVSLGLYAIAGFIFATTPSEEFSDASSVRLWMFIVLALIGAIGGNLRAIALSTLVTILVPEDGRDKANGLVGTANGVSFLGASIFSGLAVGYLGMFWVLAIAIVMSLLVIAHLWTLSIPDLPKRIRHEHDGEPMHEHDEPHEGVDVRGTIRAIQMVPGLFGLIFFHTFNNFLGGIFMSLMDAYGLLLVSVQVWGVLWGVLSLGFIIGGMVVAKRGLGKSPLRTLFLANIVMWGICSFFTIQASIVLLAVGMFVWLCLIPAVEAAEQTILQKVVPPERQGRVFGFAQSVEQAASPVTAFLIGPVAQLLFIPFMTTGVGADTIGSWFGTGTDRGLALLFTVAGLIGLVVTLLAMRSNSYRTLSEAYGTQEEQQELPDGYPA